MEKNKENKSTSKTVAIIILAVLLLGAVSYIGYDKFLVNKNGVSDKENKKGTVVDNSVKKLTKNSKEVKDLMDIFTNYNNCDDQSELFKLNEESAKLYMAYTRADFNQKISCSKIQDLVYNSHTCGYLEEETYFDNNGSLIVNDVLNERLKNNTINIVSKSDFDKKMKELFGKNIDYSYDDITVGMGCNVVHYDQSIESYIEYTGYNCGGTCGSMSATLKDIEQDGKNLSLIVDVSLESDDTKTYKYNFKLENGNYIFVNME